VSLPAAVPHPVGAAAPAATACPVEPGEIADAAAELGERHVCRTPYRLSDTVYGMSTETPLPPGAPAARDRLTAVAVVVVLGAFLSILDTTVVNVAIDTLARELDAPLATIQWVATAYLLALAATIPLTGWAADRFGAARLFTVAVALFTVGSALAAAAWSAESLIAARVVQGLGGGVVLPAGITLVGQVAGPQRMGRTMSAIGVPMLLGPALGPVLGGLLLDAVSWRWIFLVNLPVGLLTLVLAARLLPADPPPRPTQRLDRLGLALLSPGLALLVYGLSETASSGSTASTQALAPAAAGVALVAAFAVHALRRDADPLLDLRLLRVRSVAAAAVTLLLLGAGFLGTLFLLPLWFQQLRGETPLDTGLLLLPQGLGAGARDAPRGTGCRAVRCRPGRRRGAAAVRARRRRAHTGRRVDLLRRRRGRAAAVRDRDGRDDDAGDDRGLPDACSAAGRPCDGAADDRPARRQLTRRRTGRGRTATERRDHRHRGGRRRGGRRRGVRGRGRLRRDLPLAAAVRPAGARPRAPAHPRRRCRAVTAMSAE
jgi:MFS family permease